MESNRRSFLKIGGICALGLGALPVTKALANKTQPQYGKFPEALDANQWAMVVDLKTCWEKGGEDCKDCITACHTYHNVPEMGNIKEEIKWLWRESYEDTFSEQATPYNIANLKDKPIMVLCNHCTSPPCVRVCPTKATFKDPKTGIVKMDYHRCIGCRFCMAGCPYGARSFNFRDPIPHIKTELNMEYPTRERGVVEKCSFCTERLARGLLPACVEACRHGALTFGDITDPESNVRKLLAESYTIQRKPELGTGPNIYYII